MQPKKRWAQMQNRQRLLFLPPLSQRQSDASLRFCVSSAFCWTLAAPTPTPRTTSASARCTMRATIRTPPPPAYCLKKGR